MLRYGVKPIIIVLNNDGYMIERYLCDDPMDKFNDIAPWNYARLPEAFGAKDAFVAQARTVDEFDKASRRRPHPANSLTSRHVPTGWTLPR